MVGVGALTSSRLWVGFPQGSTSKAKLLWYWLDLWCAQSFDTRFQEGLKKVSRSQVLTL